MSTEEEVRQTIPGPKPVQPEFTWPERDEKRPLSIGLSVARFFADWVRKPVAWIRESVVEPNRGPKYYWYHKKYGRALPIDECYVDDQICQLEADQDWQRTLMVDRATLELLRFRFDSCMVWYGTTEGRVHHEERCKDISDTFEREKINFMIKAGELPYGATVVQAYTKQKHRMIMERRLANEAAAKTEAREAQEQS